MGSHEPWRLYSSSKAFFTVAKCLWYAVKLTLLPCGLWWASPRWWQCQAWQSTGSKWLGSPGPLALDQALHWFVTSSDGHHKWHWFSAPFLFGCWLIILLVLIEAGNAAMKTIQAEPPI